MAIREPSLLVPQHLSGKKGGRIYKPAPRSGRGEASMQIAWLAYSKNSWRNAIRSTEPTEGVPGGSLSKSRKLRSNHQSRAGAV